MGKAPAFQFYPKDWIGDTELAMCSPSTRGIWITALCTMWQSKTRGKISGNAEQLCRLLGCTDMEFQKFLAEGGVTKFVTITVRDEIVTLVNRRMYKENLERKANAKRQLRFRQKHKKVNNAESNGVNNSKVTPYSPSPTPINNIYSASFVTFWEAYPRKSKKSETYEIFQQINPDEQVLKIMLSAVKAQIASEEWKKEKGKWIPSAINWLKGECWKNIKIQSNEARLCACGCNQVATMQLGGKWYATYSHSQKRETA